MLVFRALPSICFWDFLIAMGWIIGSERSGDALSWFPDPVRVRA